MAPHPRGPFRAGTFALAFLLLPPLLLHVAAASLGHATTTTTPLHALSPLVRQDTAVPDPNNCMTEFHANRTRYAKCLDENCFLFLAEEPYTTLGKNMTQKLFNCTEHAAAFDGLSGISFDIFRNISSDTMLPGAQCVYAGPKCLFNDLVAFLNATSTTYRFAIMGMLLEVSERMTPRLLPSTSFFDDKMVIIGRNPKQGPMGRLRRPFRDEAWILFFVIVFVFFAFLVLVVWVFSPDSFSFINMVLHFLGDYPDERDDDALPASTTSASQLPGDSTSSFARLHANVPGDSASSLARYNGPASSSPSFTRLGLGPVAAAGTATVSLPAMGTFGCPPPPPPPPPLAATRARAPAGASGGGGPGGPGDSTSTVSDSEPEGAGAEGRSRTVHQTLSAPQLGGHQALSAQPSGPQAAPAAVDMQLEFGSEAARHRDALYKSAVLLWRIALSAFLVVLLLFYEVAVVNFLFLEQSSSASVRVTKLGAPQLAKFAVLKNSALEDVWAKTVDPYGEFKGKYPWYRCLNEIDCFDQLLMETPKTEVEYVVTFNALAQYRIFERGQCNLLTVYSTERRLYNFGAGWLYSKKVNRSIRLNVDKAILDLRVTDKMRELVENTMGGKEKRCKPAGGDIGAQIVILPLGLLVGPCLLGLMVVLGMSWKRRADYDLDLEVMEDSNDGFEQPTLAEGRIGNSSLSQIRQRQLINEVVMRRRHR